MIDEGETTNFRKAAYFSVVVGDILDRLLWRIRPYEKEPGMADEFIEKAMSSLSDAFETYGARKDFDRILDKLDDAIVEGRAIIDPAVPRKPLIGIVGEIYLRTHVQANQEVIRMLEKYGAEVVNASIAEWVNYTTYDRLREAKIGLRMSLKQLRFGPDPQPPEVHPGLRHRALLPAHAAEPGIRQGEGGHRSPRRPPGGHSREGASGGGSLLL